MSKYTLKEFEHIAYEFAIRNPRVIELIESELTDDSVQELATYGVDATVERTYGDESETVNSLEELYLVYDHLDIPDSYKLGDKTQRRLTHPESRLFLKVNPESMEDALIRIDDTIQTIGGRWKNLMDGTYFKDYDAVNFDSKTVYSLDPSKNRSKSIRKNLLFIKEWINPEKYLQLLTTTPARQRRY